MLSNTIKSPAVSVIIPVYKAEPYIEKCARSLFGQTLADIEFIFVDDCSPDQSIDVLEKVLDDFPQRRQHVKILRHASNRGVAQARTTGMKAMTGDFMIHCDPDDWIDPNAYETMLDTASKLDADIVECKMVIYPGEKLLRENGVEKCTVMSGIEAIRRDMFMGNITNKLIRSSIIKNNNIYPFAGINFCEDLNVGFRAFCFAKKVAFIPDRFYHYLIHDDSEIHSSTRKKIIEQGIPNIRKLEDFVNTLNIENPDSLTEMIKTDCRVSLFYEQDFGTWASLWPETRRCLLRCRRLSMPYRLYLYLLAPFPGVLEFVQKSKEKIYKALFR